MDFIIYANKLPLFLLKTIIIDLNQHYTLLFLAIHEYFKRFVKSHVPYKLSLFDCGHRVEHLLAVDAVVGIGVDSEVAHAKAGEVLEEVGALAGVHAVVLEFDLDDDLSGADVRPLDRHAQPRVARAPPSGPYEHVSTALVEEARKIISFAGVLQQDVFPLPQLLQMTMRYGAAEMRRPIEVEFACNLNADRTGSFFLLQIRPIVDSKQMLDEDICAISDDRCLLRSHN